MELLQNLQPWHWLSLGIFLLVIETLGAGGFFLGIAAAALAVAGLCALFPDLLWSWQAVIFSVLSVAFTIFYWKRFRKFNEATDQPLLNSRVQRLVGRKVALLVAVESGTGKVQIEDALWSVSCQQDLPTGTIVKVVGAEGMTLLVEAVK